MTDDMKSILDQVEAMTKSLSEFMSAQAERSAAHLATFDAVESLYALADALVPALPRPAHDLSEG